MPMADDHRFVVVVMADAIVLIIVPFLFQRLELSPATQRLGPFGWRDLARNRKGIQGFSIVL